MTHSRKTAGGALATAVLLMPALLLGASPAAAAETDATISVAADGTVATEPTFDGPQITEIRVINEQKFLEIYWDRYVDEKEAVSPENIVLTNGDRTIDLTAKPATGRTDTIFFDKKNEQMAATDANSMERLPDDLHLASIAYTGTIDMSEPLTLTVTGSAIVDSEGAQAKDAVYTGIPKLDYYTQSVTTDTGIVVKANSRVDAGTLTLAAAQVDVELAKTKTGIAAQMTDFGCSLAVYASRENAYLIPEHRGGYDPEMYDVEGYGGSTYNNCVSSISERNVLRTRGNTDPFLNTSYTNENILIHEFGHAVKLVGIETMTDTTLADEFYAAYENAYLMGLWPNTYAIGNSDEFFATLSAIWFDVMAEKPDWTDGVRSPINTRAELKEYDPTSYAFFEKIYPSDLTLPAPWDEPAPDEYHGDYTELPEQEPRVTATDVAFGSDQFRISTQTVSGDFQIDRFAGDAEHPDRDVVVWFTWGDGVWSIDYDNGFYTISASDGSGVLSATSDTEVRYAGIVADATDDSQKWRFVPDTSTPDAVYDGQLVNAANGRALALNDRANTGVSLTLTDAASGTRWMLEDTTRTEAQGTAAYVLPVTITITSGAQNSDEPSVQTFGAETSMVTAAARDEAMTIDVAQQGFSLPNIADVFGADWSRDGYTFSGWSIAGGDSILPADWVIPDGTTALSIEAVWETANQPGQPGEPEDPAEPAVPGDDSGSPGEAPSDEASDAAGELPRTGADIIGAAAAALVALLLGGGLMLVRRRPAGTKQ
ncbi:LPXTG cell wall anchor domain-containing protein [Paramicrobacterium fandaimingii]|uniref:LPXTG cell wall anchor domain-containing protein n=1 Tax=Paramicrobacterium fandaimingii TaxID=2708079 RepID=UPI00141FD249|nr:LPXTG cell wall anchor domain-containing protein [Microbacterium fandaimingii]